MVPTRSRSIFGAVFFSTVSLACFVYCFASVFKLALFLSTDLLGKDSLKQGPSSSLDQKDGDGDFLSNPLVQDVGLLLLFPLQHLIMTSWLFKRLLSAVRLDVVERSLYVASTGLVLQVAINNWQTVGESDPFWDFPVNTSRFLWLVFTLVHIFGWVSISGSAVILDYPEMMGVKQAYYYALGLDDPLSIKSESVRQFYSNNRLPIFTGVMMVLWLIPCMTLDRLVLAAFWTLYLLLWQSLSVTDYVYMCIMLDRKREALRARLTMPSILFFLLRTSLIVVTLACVAIVLYLITCLYMWLLVPIVILSVFTLFALYHTITNSGSSQGLSTYLAESVVILVSAAALALGVLYPQFWPAFWAGVALLWCVAKSAGSSLSTQVIVLLLSGGAAAYLGVYYQLWWAAVWVGVSMLGFLANQAGVSFSNSGSTSPAAGVLTLASVGSAVLGYLYGQWIPAAVVAAVVALLLIRQFSAGVSGVSLRALSLPIAALFTLLLLTALVASVAVGILYGDWIPAGVAGILAAGALAKQHGLTSTPEFSSTTVLLSLAAASAVAIGVLYSQWIPAAVVAAMAAAAVAKQRQWVSLPKSSSGGIALPSLLLSAVAGTVAVGVMYSQWIPAAVAGTLLGVYGAGQVVSLSSDSAASLKTVVQALVLLVSVVGSVVLGVLYAQWIPAALVAAHILAMYWFWPYFSLPSASTLSSKKVMLFLLLLHSAAASVAVGVLVGQWIPAAVVGALTALCVVYQLGQSFSLPLAPSKLALPELSHLLALVGTILLGVLYSQWIPAGIIGVMALGYFLKNSGLGSSLPEMSAVSAGGYLLPLLAAGSSAVLWVLYSQWIPAAIVGALAGGYLVKQSGALESLPSVAVPSRASVLPILLLIAAISSVAIGVLYGQWIPAAVASVGVVGYVANRRGLALQSPSSASLLQTAQAGMHVLIPVGAVAVGVVYGVWIIAGIVGVLFVVHGARHFGLTPSLPAASAVPYIPLLLLLALAGSLAAGLLYSTWIPAGFAGGLTAGYMIKRSGLTASLPSLPNPSLPALSTVPLSAVVLLVAASSAIAIGVLYAQWIPAGIVGVLMLAYIANQRGLFQSVPSISRQQLPSFPYRPVSLFLGAVCSLLASSLASSDSASVYVPWILAGIVAAVVVGYLSWKYLLPAVSQKSLPPVPRGAVILLLGAAAALAAGILYAQWIPAGIVGVLMLAYIANQRGLFQSIPSISRQQLPSFPYRPVSLFLGAVCSVAASSLAIGSLTLGSASAVAIGVLYAQWIPLGVVAALGVAYILGQKGVFSNVPKLTPTFSLSKDVLILVIATIASLLIGFFFNQWWSAIATGIAVVWYVARRMGVTASLPNLALPKPSLPKLTMSRALAEVSLLSAATVSSVLLGVFYGQWVPLAFAGVAITWFVLRHKGIQVSLPASLELDPLAQSLIATSLIFLSLAVLFEAWLIVWATLVALAVIVVSKATNLVSYIKSIEVRTLLSTLGTRLRGAYVCASTMDVLNGSLWYERLSRYAVVVGMVLACLAVAWRFSALEMSLVLVALLLTAQVADHYRWGTDGVRVAAEQETQ
ncbi:NRM [Branchiostoma lanceolatum]|uniref:Nurim n=1 Tax=Branchiostoma lanceolatum TaxID=7740 RepID=A0A8K0EQ99_BRALA|nr:NRM [Branchiostoma lanceolatum]